MAGEEWGLLWTEYRWASRHFVKQQHQRVPSEKEDSIRHWLESCSNRSKEFGSMSCNESRSFIKPSPTSTPTLLFVSFHLSLSLLIYTTSLTTPALHNCVYKRFCREVGNYQLIDLQLGIFFYVAFFNQLVVHRFMRALLGFFLVTFLCARESTSVWIHSWECYFGTQ